MLTLRTTEVYKLINWHGVSKDSYLIYMKRRHQKKLAGSRYTA